VGQSTPPKPPRVANKDDLQAALTQQAAAQAQGTGAEDEEGEGSAVDEIRTHIDAISDLLDQLEAEQQ
jgi:hypothetical protein